MEEQLAFKKLSEGMCKSYYCNQNFFQQANGIYFVKIIKNTPLRKENSPIVVALAFEHFISTFLFLHYQFHKTMMSVKYL